MQKLNTTLLEQTAQDRGKTIIRSALWAAAGDALGWITELSHGASNVKRRSGTSFVKRPVTWTRMIGGRGGPKVELPAGTYSDDTQLRLAVSRSIRGDGIFDVEAFAKVELTIWPTYALGGGLGTKAAALSLSRRSTSWFSNFFESGMQTYMHGGGNGAAMRIQPHVWSSKGSIPDLILSVLRDALVTHGHPQGFCGAVFHALALHSTIASSSIPSPDEWGNFIDTFLDIPEILDRDPQISAFWRSAWENQAGITLNDAVENARNAAMIDLHKLQNAAKFMNPNDYRNAIDSLGCSTPEFRGAGLKTAMLASALAYMHRHSAPDEALVQAANELNSDTDTIATMTGALLGVLAKEEPSWDIQDRNYIAQEAGRLFDISQGHTRESFMYPDLARWTPPSNQLAAVGLVADKMALGGLGYLEPIDKEYSAGDSSWQWCRLPFGQTILAKRKSNLTKMPVDQIPSVSIKLALNNPQSNQKLPQRSFSFSGDAERQEHSPSLVATQNTKNWSIDTATDEAIRADFDAMVVGKLINQCIDESESIENAIAFVAILAKAKIARLRKRR
ncbi:ADP-ribosylglycohydrolase family protein [Paenacidovorax monticola]|uniref:ADP-ribosylglycohydrolase family protein n=1 Tax=Paenacidovorax monticola TaxID=1926868 RepID=A0A7H0HKS8_9BURK|nr:ADP-ribosylglycohydrolase family protein [Paenacidovorax monticola]QNP61144.1 ADP-ribosylglycohydrolase family protein [Paenacidovorax monticola]